ncbi:MAG: glycosyltransferase [Rhodobacteraceae bacterium]|jgi:succinoglycan biosynthesis protein ExoO|nr:glycosyltransferase [Paracoccaceae bacterium]
MAPLVSIIMANYRGAAHIGAAIASVQGQTLADWDLIVSDDGSPDDSVAIVEAAASRDPRIRLVRADRPSGPGAARNRALDHARGAWIAICDSDDLMHPDRLARLLAAAEAGAADLVADDMVFFGAQPGTGGRTLLQPLDLRAPMDVTAETWVRAALNTGGLDRGSLPSLGYLKPMIRRAWLDGVRYDPALRVGEDFDLVLRVLLAGARFVVLPDPLYLYRRHAGSVSHRLSVPVVAAMIAAQARLPGQTGAVADLLAQRQAGLDRQLAFERLVAAIKARKAGAALSEVALRPSLLRLLMRSTAEALSRRRRRVAPAVQTLRPDLSLHLGPAAPGAAGASATRAMAVPPLPAPGQAWDTPPALPVAMLGALAETNRLTLAQVDDAAAWARWHVEHLQATAP